MRKEIIGVNEDGSDRYNFISETGHMVGPTGPISGQLIMDDGTVYDVSDHFVEVAHEVHRLELANKIGAHYEKHGHPHQPGVSFKVTS